jgi:hypothetical protein
MTARSDWMVKEMTDTQTVFRKRLKSLMGVVGYIAPEKLPEDKWYTKNGKIKNIDKSTPDGATFRPAQGYFVPARPFGKKYFIIENQGKLI